jgi:hypothetical protein
MKVGTAKVDITPRETVDLTGYLAREQRSTGVLDPLSARALYVESGPSRLLWLHADLLGFERETVERFRRWASARLGLSSREVILSTCHTHSGPAVMRLFGCGRFEEAYVERLAGWMEQAAERAVARTEPAAPVVATTMCDLAVDRRGKASAHTDPRLTVLAWQRPDGTYAAALVNYGMHNVALGPANRLVSGDVIGHAEAALERVLPGSPVTLFTLGGAGNVNPPRPAPSDSPDQMRAWGDLLAQKAQEALAGPRPLGDRLTIRAAVLGVPLDVYDAQRICRFAERIIEKGADLPADVRGRLVQAVREWRGKMTRLAERHQTPETTDLQIAAVAFDDLWLVGLSAEVFSSMGDRLRELTGREVRVVSYANGVFGYLPTAEAFAEGGYEPAESFIYYGNFPLKPEAFEQVARRAADLVVTGA